MDKFDHDNFEAGDASVASPIPSGPPPPFYDNPGGHPSSGFGYNQSPSIPLTQPVVQQPASTHTTVVIQQQPQIIMSHGRNWNSGLCGCCSDCESCCCTLFCMSCYLCSISSEMGEGLCMPCCIPYIGAIAMLRQKLRMQEKIHGSIRDDWHTACCCGPCALCQLKRELDYSRCRLDAYNQLHNA